MPEDINNKDILTNNTTIQDGSNKPDTQPKPHATGNPIGRYMSTHTHYDKNSDDLLDVHVGNPLDKITRLLEEIKKQKAFNFTLKGSLGIAGVALTLSIFGVFGGGKLLCDKGVQTQIGVVKIIGYPEAQVSTVPFISSFIDLISAKNYRNRIILEKNGQTLSLPYAGNVPLRRFDGEKVIVTGRYNSCNQSLTLSETNGIEIY